MIPGSRTCASSCASGSASSTAVRSPAAAAETRRKSSGLLLTSKVCATVGPPPGSNNDGSRKAQEADRSNGPAFENSRGPRHIWGRHHSSGFIHGRTSYDFVIFCYDLPWPLLESFHFSHRTWIIHDTWYLILLQIASVLGSTPIFGGLMGSHVQIEHKISHRLQQWQIITHRASWHPVLDTKDLTPCFACNFEHAGNFKIRHLHRLEQDQAPVLEMLAVRDQQMKWTATKLSGLSSN